MVCCQEVLTYWHLRLLARRMHSFRHISYRRAAAGPAGGLVTFSRLRVSSTVYLRFGVPPQAPGVSWPARYRSALKGALVTRLARLELCVINTHPVANRDGCRDTGCQIVHLRDLISNSVGLLTDSFLL